MADIVVSIASKVAEYLVAPVGRQCGYVMFSNSYVGQLKEELENLDGVQRSVQAALNNMRDIRHEVNRWKNNAETVANKARALLDNDQRAKKTCFCGWLPNPKERYCLGRDARKTVQVIQELIMKGEVEEVYDDESVPPGRVLDRNSPASDGVCTIFDSRAPVFQGIMKALDDEKLKVIGVYGPGGVGKTTLLEEVEKKLRKEGKGRPFHLIVKAKVSQTPDLNDIQYQIADALGLDLKDKQSSEGRRELLFKRLQMDPNEKVLIILDDLWDKLDLKAIGIPLGDESTGCKLLLSSRFQDVLEQKMHADQTFRLEGLNNDEAFRLFEKKVGDWLKDDWHLKSIAAKVVEKLAGLPLLITSVASTLKYDKVSAWNYAKMKLEMEPNIETVVKLSYNHLRCGGARRFFLLCGLIGGTIRVQILLELGMGLGLFELMELGFEGFNETMQGARDRLNTMLRKLRSVCLLLDGDDDEEIVTIHDLYSEAAVSTPFSGDNFLIMNNNSWSEEKLEKCWAICLKDVDRDRLAVLARCGFPHLKVLMLSGPGSFWSELWHIIRQTQPDLLDFTHMKQLRVLHIRNMGIPNLTSSIQILESLRSLRLDNCGVEDVAILGKLKALQILSFAKSSISKLPKEIGDLTNLRSLDLTKCTNLMIIEPGVLKGLVNLEELLMWGSFDRWMGNDEVPSESCNAKLAELKSLTKLTALDISIPNPTILLEAGDLPFGNLTSFWIDIGGSGRETFWIGKGGRSGWKNEGSRIMKLNIKGCDSILSQKWVQKTLHKTECLYLDGLGEPKENAHASFSAHELCTQGFPQLKHLDIRNSPSIKYITSSSGGISLTAFTRLESLYLENLVNLEKICRGSIAPECLSKLKAVIVGKCDRLTNLWCLSRMRRFVHLEEIEVRCCESMRAIAIDDAREDIVVLPNVRSLQLVRLPKMTSFCIDDGITLEGAPIQMKEVAPKEEGSRSKGVVMSFPSLTDISIVGCCNFGAFNSSPTSVDRKLDKTAEETDESPQPLFNEMVKLPNVRSLLIEDARCKELWNNQIPDDSFCKLEFLLLKYCDNLQCIAPSHMWKRLQRCLDILQVESCCSIKIIYECEKTVTESGKLRRLVLRNLENLRHIWQSDGLPKVPHANLRFIEVQSCPRLRMLFPTFTSEFLGQIKELVVESCEDMELIVGHEECEEAISMTITFSELTTLRLFKLPKFKSFLPEKYSAEFSSLQVLSRVSCGTEPDQGLGDWESYRHSRKSELSREMMKYQWI